MMYDPKLRNIVNKAFSRLYIEARNAGPFLGTQIIEWIQMVYKTDKPEDAFMNPGSFPMLLLPWYAEASIYPKQNVAFQSDLVYSTVNGYYYIRLMDNLMDGHGEEGVTLLPALNFFHTQFQSPYQRYFEDNHPFWDYFNAVWLYSAEVTMRDAQLVEIDRDLFVEISAQKTCAAKIPVAAVFFHFNCPERIDVWARFMDLFGCWHQMWNDLFDWIKDTRSETQTYFLSEANRRKRPDEPVVDWVIREGFDWGMGMLDGWMDELELMVGDLNCSQMERYLNERKVILSEQKAEAVHGLKQTGKLLDVLKKSFARLDR